MAHVIIVPGLAVHRYILGPAEALRRAGHTVQVLDPPAWRSQPTDLRRYGHQLAAALDAAQDTVDLLIGLSVGTQAAAVAAATTTRVRRLLLVSPTVDPGRRSRHRLIKGWLVDGDDHPASPSFASQLPDWRRAGPRRIYRGLVSATQVLLEEVLDQVRVPVTLVHADADLLSPLDFALMLAELEHVETLVMPDAPHSWPVGDPGRFTDLVADLVAESGPV